MVLMVSDGSRPFVWTCPYCGWTQASETAREDRAAKATHRPQCWGIPISAFKR